MGDNDKDNNTDITRIEDLSEYLHDEDEDLNLEEELDDNNTDSLDDNSDFSFEAEDNELPDLPEVEQNDQKQSFSDEKTAPDIDITGLNEDSQDQDFNFGQLEDQQDGNNDIEQPSFDDQDPFSNNDFDNNDQEDDFNNQQNVQDDDLSFASDDDFVSNEHELSNSEEGQQDQDLLESDDQDDFAETSTSGDESNEQVDEQLEQAPPPPPALKAVPQDSDASSDQTSTESEKQKEDFSDLKKYAESISYGDLSGTGNPPFSLLIQGLRYKEDRDDIVILLREYGIIQQGKEQEFQDRLSRGSLLIPRISEFAAIFLAHKLRRFDISIKMGPADLIQEPKSYPGHEDRGLVTKSNITMNKRENINLSTPSSKDFIFSTLANPVGIEIAKYLGIVSAQVQYPQGSNIQDDHRWNEILELLNEKLKNEAKKRKAHGLVGVYYQVEAQDEHKIIMAFGNAIHLREDYAAKRP